MVLYALVVAARALQEGWPGLPALAGLTAMGGVWVYLLVLGGLFKSLRFRSLANLAARTLIGLSILLNGVLLVRALLRGELMALVRLLSLTCLLYGFRILNHWPNG